jgi:DNA mismatch repair ATPase MutL
MIVFMETLSKLFSGASRVKVMRLFLFNPDVIFSLDQIMDKAKIFAKEAESEVIVLQKAGMIKKRKASRLIQIKKRGKVKEVKRQVLCWYLDPHFEYLLPMQNLLINTRPLRPSEILKRLFAGCFHS